MNDLCSNPENSFLAICGQLLSIEFTLPFTDFLPDTVPFVFKVLGEQLDLSAFLPDTNTSHDILFTLDQSARLVGREGQLIWKRELQEGKWRRKCQYNAGWIDCWWVTILLPIKSHLFLRSVPSLVLAIEFLYHPAPMDGPPPQADITTPDKESSLLGPLRFSFSFFLPLSIVSCCEIKVFQIICHICLSLLFNALNLLPYRASQEEQRSFPPAPNCLYEHFSTAPTHRP